MIYLTLQALAFTIAIESKFLYSFLVSSVIALVLQFVNQNVRNVLITVAGLVSVVSNDTIIIFDPYISYIAVFTLIFHQLKDLISVCYYICLACYGLIEVLQKLIKNKNLLCYLINYQIQQQVYYNDAQTQKKTARQIIELKVKQYTGFLTLFCLLPPLCIFDEEKQSEMSELSQLSGYVITLISGVILLKILHDDLKCDASMILIFGLFVLSQVSIIQRPQVFGFISSILLMQAFVVSVWICCQREYYEFQLLVSSAFCIGFSYINIDIRKYMFLGVFSILLSANTKQEKLLQKVSE